VLTYYLTNQCISNKPIVEDLQLFRQAELVSDQQFLNSQQDWCWKAGCCVHRQPRSRWWSWGFDQDGWKYWQTSSITEKYSLYLDLLYLAMKHYMVLL